jgi:hypothetical protein
MLSCWRIYYYKWNTILTVEENTRSSDLQYRLATRHDRVHLKKNKHTNQRRVLCHTKEYDTGRGSMQFSVMTREYIDSVVHPHISSWTTTTHFHSVPMAPFPLVNRDLCICYFAVTRWTWMQGQQKKSIRRSTWKMSVPSERCSVPRVS